MSQQTIGQSRPYERGEVSTGQFGRALRRLWWIPLITLLLGAALGWAASTVMGTTYTSTASGVVVANGGSDSTEALAGENLSKSKAVTFGSISGTSSTASAVIDELNLEQTPEALLQNVTTTVPLDTSEVRVSATAESPEQAQKLAGAWVDVLGTNVGELGDNTDAPGTAVELTPVGQASLPQDPSSTDPVVLIAAGALIGLLLGVFTVIAQAQYRRY